MGQIVGLKAKCKRANLNALGSVPTPAEEEYILVSSDNSMNAAGQGNFDCYIVGDGKTAANKLTLNYIEELSHIDTEYENSPQSLCYLNADANSDSFGQLVSVNDSYYCVSDFIQVEKGESVIFKAITGSGTSGVVNCAGYIFYDSNKTPVLGVPTVTKRSWSYEDYNVYIPDGVAYFRTSYASIKNKTFTIKKSITKIIPELLKDSDNIIEKDVVLSSRSVVIANESNTSYGNTISIGDSSYNSTDYINVEGYKSISYTALLGCGDSRGTGNAGAVFYNSEKQPIQGHVTCVGNRWEFGTVNISVPADAVYARLTIAYTYNYTIYLSGEIKDIYTTKDELDNVEKKLSTVVFNCNELVRGWFITSGFEEECSLEYAQDNNLLITLEKKSNCPRCLLTINCSNLTNGEKYTLILNYSSTGTGASGLYKFTNAAQYVAYGGGAILQGTNANFEFDFVYDENYKSVGWFVNDLPVGTVFTINSCNIELRKTISEAIQENGSKNTVSTDDTPMLKQLLYPQDSVLSLLHFSDIHGDDTAALKIKEYYDSYSDYIDDILNTGDTVLDTNADSLGFINDANLGVALMTIGNHDTWGNSEQSFVYNKFFAPYISSWGVTQPSDAAANNLMYWYKDYTSKGIRLIGIDCMYPTEAQFAWLTSTLNDAKNNNLSVVLASHYMPLNSSYSAHVLYHGDLPTFSALTDYGLTNAPQVMNNSFIQIVQDFIDSDGNFVCWICGHRHNDAIFYPDGYSDQLVITIDNAGAKVPNATGDRTGEYLYCANVVGIDANSKLIKLFRAGCKSDKWMRNINVLTYDYANKKVITNY